MPCAASAQSASELVGQASMHERSLEFARAEASYREALRLEPSSRAARRARVRIEWLEARKIDGAYRELVILETARRSRDTDLAAFEERIASFPPSLVRAEARLVLGQAAARAGDRARAERAFASIADDASAPRTIKNAAALAHAELASRGGEGSRAIEIVERAGLGETAEAGDLVRARNEHVAAVAASIGAGACALFLLLLARPLRRPTLLDVRTALLSAIYAIVVPAIVATLYSPDALDSFLWFALFGTPFFVLARLVQRARAWAALGLGLGITSAAVLSLSLAGGLSSFLP
jgi:tetratricopeptide (TPR) repeat protein